MNDLPLLAFGAFRQNVGHVLHAAAPHRLAYQRLLLTPGSNPREPSLAPTAPWAARQATAASTFDDTEIVLGGLEKALARMEAAPCPRDPKDCRWVASRWLSALLEVAVQSSATWRSSTGRRTDPGDDLSHGG